jgi:hypothetical protein
MRRPSRFPLSPTLPIVLALLLSFSSGCGSDPASGRLATGAEAIIYHPTATATEIEGTNGRESTPVMIGTHVEVIDDGDKDSTANRRVRVKVVGGESTGATGTIDRGSLRPVAK